MHILMVAPEQIPVPGNGSVEICMLSIAKQLALAHKVTIVSRQKVGLPKISKQGNLTIVRVPSGSSQTYIAAVLRYLKGKSFDFIQVDNRPHYMAKIKNAFPRTPVSLFLHSLTFVPLTKTVAASIAKANLIIANSDSLKRNLSRRFSNQATKIRRVHLGVDTHRFNPTTRDANNPVFNVLFAGRVIPRKGVDVLIKAIGIVSRHVPNVKLTVAGGGKAPYINQLKALAKTNNVNISFTGRIAHAKMDQIYRTADCFVCPSQLHEAFGLVNVEAMASGLPVVASNIGGIGEIVKHASNGYLVDDYSNPEAHATFIVNIAQNKQFAASFAKQARHDAVSRFSWNQTATKLMEIYKSQRA
ncbi:glycosyltransferase family 4 protein [Paenibacillus sp. 481]|uniref:glycosyltransferase family 4 protein n=1 Tax=Paenibacillus sp. 481 TaxID=2835869 RepID=UPI001E329944|nr:glycosyltransferase family 4 protein [Paenibacillus sp. 481]UHA73166.1 glycosyltransferase family 4 protein [Paenibacillus sp. 481]